jgi:hypothetical protein
MTWQDKTAAFAQAARSYCEFLDSPTPSSTDLLTLAQLLAALAERALSLPADVDRGSGDAELGDVPYDHIADRLRDIDLELYWDIFDPLQIEPEEPCANSLLDDVCDIYVDLTRGLRLFDAGDAAEALWYWRFFFWAHWGEHLVGAQRAMYLRLRDST